METSKRVIESVSPDTTSLKMVSLKDMKVDTTYQRFTNKKRVKKIAESWDDRKANLIHVSHRSDGYYVMDGNHTRLAYESIGGEKLPCRVYEGLTPEDEARLYFELNSAHKKPSFNEILKAKAAAGSELECSYFKLLDEANIPYELYNGAHGRKLKCHHALISVYERTTPTLMLRALKVAKRALDDRDEFYQGGLFPGLCSAIIMHPEIDDHRLIVAVKKTSTSKIREIADRYKHGFVVGSNGATACFRKAYLDLYNKGLKSNRIVE